MPASKGKQDCISSATKLHDNPLFACTPSDFIENGPRQLDYSSDEFKENVGSSEKNVLAFSARTSSKRVLGEKNVEEDASEPPKTIRALYYPNEISTYNAAYRSEENSPTSLSSSSSDNEISTPRFTLSSPQKCEEPSDDESMDGSTYDPRQNLRTSRPKFLRYRPDWRLQLMSSLEFTTDSPEFKTDTETNLEFTADNETNEPGCTATSDDRTIDADDNNVQQTLKNSEEDIEMEPNSSQVLNAETEAVKEQVQEKKRGNRFFKVLACLALLGAMVASLNLNGAGVWTGFLSESEFLGETLRRYLPNNDVQKQVYHHDIYDWDWFDEYDGYGTEHLTSFSVDNDDFAALVKAVMFGTEQDIHDRYLTFMEFDEGYGSFVEDLYDFRERINHGNMTRPIPDADVYSGEQLDLMGKQVSVVQEHLDSDGGTSGVNVTILADETGDHDNHTSTGITRQEGYNGCYPDVFFNDSLSAAGQVLEMTRPDGDSFNDTLLSADPSELSRPEGNIYTGRIDSFNDSLSADPISELSWTDEQIHSEREPPVDLKLPSFYEVALLFSAILGIKAFIAYRSMLNKTSRKKNKPEGRTEAGKTDPTPKLLEDVLNESDASREVPYGSFTAYIVANQGTENEHVTLTPVRRSSRIRAQSPTVAAKRRLLLSQA